MFGFIASSSNARVQATFFSGLRYSSVYHGTGGAQFEQAGMWGEARQDADGGISTMYGVKSRVNTQSSGTTGNVGEVRGSYSGVDISGTTVMTMSKSSNYYARADANAGTMPDHAGVRIEDFLINGGTLTNATGIYLEEQTNGVLNRQIYSEGGDWVLGSNGDAIVFGGGRNANISWDGSSFVFDYGDTKNDIAWFSGNISALGYVTRTSVYDTNDGSAIDNIKDTNELLDLEGKINHSAFYGYTTYDVIDYSRPVIEEYIREECDEVIELKNGTIQLPFCENVTKQRTIYPHTKIEEGVSLNKEIDVLRQATYDQQQIIINQTILIQDLINRVEALEKDTPTL